MLLVLAAMKTQVDNPLVTMENTKLLHLKHSTISVLEYWSPASSFLTKPRQIKKNGGSTYFAFNSFHLK
jgi:hypothetical protein